MNKFEMVKGTVGFVTTIGVNAIIGNIVKSTTPESIHVLKKVCIGVGSFVISSMVTDKVGDYVDEKMDGFIVDFKDVFKKEEPKEVLTNSR